jgi:hypothetical protein
VGIGTDLLDRLVHNNQLPGGLESGGRLVRDRVALDRTFDRWSRLVEDDCNFSPEGATRSSALTRAALLEAIRAKI